MLQILKFGKGSSINCRTLIARIPFSIKLFKNAFLLQGA